MRITKRKFLKFDIFALLTLVIILAYRFYLDYTATYDSIVFDRYFAFFGFAIILLPYLICSYVTNIRIGFETSIEENDSHKPRKRVPGYQTPEQSSGNKVKKFVTPQQNYEVFSTNKDLIKPKKPFAILITICILISCTLRFLNFISLDQTIIAAIILSYSLLLFSSARQLGWILLVHRNRLIEQDKVYRITKFRIFYSLISLVVLVLIFSSSVFSFYLVSLYPIQLLINFYELFFIKNL